MAEATMPHGKSPACSWAKQYQQSEEAWQLCRQLRSSAEAEPQGKCPLGP